MNQTRRRVSRAKAKRKNKPILDEIEAFATEWEQFASAAKDERQNEDDKSLETLTMQLQISRQTRVHTYNTVLYNQLLRKVNEDAKVIIAEIRNICLTYKRTPAWHFALYRGATRALCIKIASTLAESLGIADLVNESGPETSHLDLESFERIILHTLVDSTADYEEFVSTNGLENSVLCEYICHCAAKLEAQDYRENIEDGHSDIVILHPDSECHLKQLCTERWTLMKPLLLVKHIFQGIINLGHSRRIAKFRNELPMSFDQAQSSKHEDIFRRLD